MIRVEELYPLILEAFENNQTFDMPMKGTSMQPLLHTGDIVELDKIDTINKNDIIFYRRLDGAFVMHRVYSINADGSLNFIGDHQIQLEHGIKPEQCFAKIVAYKKKNSKNKKPLKGFLYKLYLFTLKSFFIRRVYIKCLR